MKLNPRVRALIHRKIDEKLDIEETILEVVRDCANLAYELSDDIEEGERIAKQICDLWGAND